MVWQIFPEIFAAIGHFLHVFASNISYVVDVFLVVRLSSASNDCGKLSENIAYFISRDSG